MLGLLVLLSFQATSKGKCSYKPNQIIAKDISSVEEIKDKYRPSFLIMNNSKDASAYTVTDHWKEASKLFPQVNFIDIDCSINPICSQFDFKDHSFLHALILPSKNAYAKKLIFDENISMQEYVHIIQEYANVFPVNDQSYTLTPSNTNSFYQNNDLKIFVLYNSQCSEQEPFINYWLKQSRRIHSKYAFGFLDCSKYHDECLLWDKYYQILEPKTVLYSHNSKEYKTLNSYPDFNNNNLQIFDSESKKNSKSRLLQNEEMPTDDSGKCGGYANYNFYASNGTLVITGQYSMDNYNDFSLIPWISYRDYIKHIIVENDITDISNNVFANCSNLETVFISNKCQNIGYNSFLNCYKLSQVIINSNLSTISDDAFKNCTNLSEVYYTGIDHPNCQSKIFDGCNLLEFVYVNVKYRDDEVGKIPIKKDIICGQIQSIKYSFSLHIGDLKIYGKGQIVGNDNPLYLPWYEYSSYVQKIYIEEGVTSLGTNAFANCMNAINISLPESLITIGKFAFLNCCNLTEIFIPKKVKEIGIAPFISCVKLATITVDENNGYFKMIDDILYTKNETVLVRYPPTKSDSSYTIPTKVTYIYDGAFSNTTNITTLVIGGQVTTVGQYSFSSSGIRILNIPFGFETISDYAFTHCLSLHSVYFEDSIKYIGTQAFVYCESLYYIYYLGENAPTFGKESFFYAKAGLKAYTIPTYRGENNIFGHIGFERCVKYDRCGNDAIYLLNSYKNLLTIHGTGLMYSYLDRDKPWRFDYAIIHSIIIEEGIKSIGRYAFSNCYNLKSVSFPITLTSIDGSAFQSCGNLTSITLPESLQTLDDDAFSFCKNLASVNIPNSVKSIGYSPFSQCLNLKSIIIDENNQNYQFIDDVLYYKQLSRIIFYPPWKTNKTYEMPNSITSIDNCAFYGCNMLESVSISYRARTIGESAFYDCKNLKTIYIPDGVITIETYAFSGCSKLSQVEIGTTVEYIERYAFLSCPSLSTFMYHGRKEPSLGSDILPSSLEYVDVRFIYESETFGGKEARKTYDFGNCGNNMKWSYRLASKKLRIYGSGDMDNYSYSNLPAWYIIPSINLIDIEDGITSLGSYAFIDSNETTQINIPKSLISIGSGAFLSCTSLATFDVNESNEYFKSINNVLYSKDEKNLICFPPGITNTSFIIQKHITSINDYAFSYCYNLISLKFDDDIQFIGNFAFSNCTNLQSFLYFGTHEPSLPDNSFEGCSNLSEVQVLIRYDSTSFGSLSINKNLDIGELGSNIGWVSYIQEGLLTISGSGSIPNYTLTTRPSFDSYKNSIKTIIIENGITSIGDFSFAELNNLESINIPESVALIGTAPFYACSSLMSFEINENNNYFTSNDGILYSDNQSCLMFYPIVKSNSSFLIPNYVKSISDYAFANCNNLISLIIEDNVSYIGDYAFYNCINLNSFVYLSDKEPIVSSNSFEGCLNLMSIQVQMTYEKGSFGNVTVVKNFAYGKLDLNLYWLYDNTLNILIINGSGIIPNYDNSSAVPWSPYESLIKEIKIGDSIYQIGSFAFSGCNLISSLYIPGSVSFISSDSFPSSISFKSIEVNSENNYYYSKDGVLYHKRSYIIIRYPSGKENSSFTFGDNPPIYEVSPYCFINCTYLTSITMEESVGTIGKKAFANCINLDTMFLKNKRRVKSVAIDAFDGSSKLKEVMVSYFFENSTFGTKDIRKCYDIGLTNQNKYIFDDRNYSGILTITGNNDMYDYDDKSPPWSSYETLIKYIYIFNNVTSIGSHAFKGCSNLIYIDIPESVTKIYETPFPSNSSSLSINVDKNSNFFKSIDGVLYTSDESSLIWYPVGKNDTSYIIANNVSRIEKAAFSNSNLQSITLGPKVTEIYDEVFCNCSKLQNITYLGNEPPSFIGTVFCNNDELKNIFVLPSYNGTKFDLWNVTVFYPEMTIPPTTEIPESLTTNTHESQTEEIPSTEEYPIATPTPVPEIITSLDVPENANEVELDKLLNETFSKLTNDTNVNKVIIINSQKIKFNSTMEQNQFIKPKDDSEIDYNGGNLNIILPDSGKVTVSIENDEINLSINGEGEVKIDNSNSQSKSINIQTNSQINGSVKITVPEEVDNVTIDSIELKNKGTIEVITEKSEKQININVKDITASYNTNTSISNIIVLNSFNVVQTATVNIDNVTLEKAVVNFEIVDFKNDKNSWIPFFKGKFNSLPNKLILAKSSAMNERQPIYNADYILVSGLFDENLCENWLTNLEYGNSGFNSKNCEMNELLSAEDKRIVLKAVDSKDDDNKGGLSGGQIAGIVIGVIAGVAIIIVAVICVIKRKNRNNSESQDANDNADEL